MEVKLVNKESNLQASLITADVPETFGRYSILVTKTKGRLIVAVVNFGVVIEAISYENCLFKLCERGMSQPDATAIMEIVKSHIK